MSTELDHLLDRAGRNVLLGDEEDRLRDLVGELEKENATLRDWLAHCRHKPRVTELEADVARFHEGEEPCPDERAAPTPAQWLWLWNRATPAKRLHVAAQVMDDAARASRCFTGDHEKTIDHYRRRAVQAEDLQRLAHETSNRSETERARAVARVADLEEEVVNARQDTEYLKLLVAASTEPGHAVRRVVQLEAEVTRLTAGQCLDSRRMCEQHHTPPVTGCPYPQCVTARQQQETDHA